MAGEQLQRYVVMRSRKALDFQPIGNVQAEGKSSYAFTDRIDEKKFREQCYSVRYYSSWLKVQQK